MANIKVVLAVSAGIAVVAAGAFLYGSVRDVDSAFIDPADRQLVVQGKAIYANSCASCHGASLQGQPDWRRRMANGRLPAPPHDKTGHTWHHPDAMLFSIVKDGLIPGKTVPPGYQSDMPAYRDTLTDEEIVSVLAYIKSTWPPKVLEAQKEVTLQRRK